MIFVFVRFYFKTVYKYGSELCGLIIIYISVLIKFYFKSVVEVNYVV